LLSMVWVMFGAIGWPGGGASDEDVANLTRRTAEANAALVRGDIDGYLAIIDHASDYTLMAPFGGAPTRGFDTSREHRAASGFALSSASSLSRTGLYVSRRSFATRVRSGNWCIGMPIRS